MNVHATRSATVSLGATHAPTSMGASSDTSSPAEQQPMTKLRMAQSLGGAVGFGVMGACSLGAVLGLFGGVTGFKAGLGLGGLVGAVYGFDMVYKATSAHTS